MLNTVKQLTFKCQKFQFCLNQLHVLKHEGNIQIVEQNILLALVNHSSSKEMVIIIVYSTQFYGI